MQRAILVLFFSQVVRVMDGSIVTSRPVIETPLDILEYYKNCEVCRYDDKYMNLSAFKDKRFYSCFVTDLDDRWHPPKSDMEYIIKNQPCEMVNSERDLAKLRKRAGSAIAEICARYYIFWLNQGLLPPPPLPGLFDSKPQACIYTGGPPHIGEVFGSHDKPSKIKVQGHLNHMNISFDDNKPAAENTRDNIKNNRRPTVVDTTVPLVQGSLPSVDGEKYIHKRPVVQSHFSTRKYPFVHFDDWTKVTKLSVDTTADPFSQYHVSNNPSHQQLTDDPSAPPLISTDDPFAPPIISTDDPFSPPLMSTDDPIAPPLMSTDDTFAPTLKSTDDSFVPPLMSTNDPLAPPLLSTDDSFAPPLNSTDDPLAPPLISTDDSLTPPLMSTEDPLAPPLMSTNDPSVPSFKSEKLAFQQSTEVPLAPPLMTNEFQSPQLTGSFSEKHSETPRTTPKQSNIGPLAQLLITSRVISQHRKEDQIKGERTQPPYFDLDGISRPSRSPNLKPFYKDVDMVPPLMPLSSKEESTPYPIPVMGPTNTPKFPVEAVMVKIYNDLPYNKEETVAPPTPDMRTPPLPKGLLQP